MKKLYNIYKIRDLAVDQTGLYFVPLTVYTRMSPDRPRRQKSASFSVLNTLNITDYRSREIRQQINRLISQTIPPNTVYIRHIYVSLTNKYFK